MKGEGRYPNRLQERFETELAIVRSCYFTEISKMPVITGTIKPPRKRSDQIRILNRVKLSTNGIGMADKTASRETKQHIYSAFGELYPPNL